MGGAIALLVACAGSHRDDIDRFGADDVNDLLDGQGGPRLEGPALTTEIDSITFRPVAAVSESFPASTPRLYFCFTLRGSEPGQRMAIDWYREGDSEPLSSTSDVAEDGARLAAEHIAHSPFLPGPHYVAVSLDGEEIARMDFEIEADGSTPDPAMESVDVSNFGIFAGLDRRGRPRGRAATKFPAGMRQIACAFRVEGAPPGTEVIVDWYRNNSKVATTEVGEVSGDRSLSASVANRRAFPDGAYRADVTLNGTVRGTKSFTIGRARGNSGAPSVSNLALTTEIHSRSRRPAAPTMTTFEGTEESLWLCLSYENLGDNELVDVRWIQNGHDDEPMAVSTIRGSGAGNMAASFAPDGTLPPGDYHVDVVVRGEVLDSIAFTVGL